MRKSALVSIVILVLLLTGCAGIRPATKATIGPKQEDGSRVIEITQERKGNTVVEVDGDKIKMSYDSTKGSGIVEAVTDITADIVKMKMFDAITD